MSGGDQQSAANSQNGETSSTPWYYTKLDTKALERDLRDFENMFKQMKCQGGCSKYKKELTNPRHRFLCPKGHTLSGECGINRLEKYETTCLSEIVDSVDQEGEKCQEKIVQYPADPIYFAFYKNAMMWKHNQEGAADGNGR